MNLHTSRRQVGGPAGAIECAVDEPAPAPQGLRGVDLLAEDGRVVARLETPKGEMLVALDRRRVSASNPHQLLVLMIFTSVLMTIIAYLFLSNQLRPIARMAEAANLPVTPHCANLSLVTLVMWPRHRAALWRTNRTGLVILRGACLALASISMMVAEELGIPVDKVRAVLADTHQLGFNRVTAGSRTTFSQGVVLVD